MTKNLLTLDTLESWLWDSANIRELDIREKEIDEKLAGFLKELGI